MNLRDFTYLVAVAEHGHFGRAAESCFVSQPALSMQLQKLEYALGVELFERSNKSVRITPAGEEIVKHARQLLMQADEIKLAAKIFQDPLMGDFRLGIFPTLAPYYLPKAVPAIHRKLPKLRLLLIEDKTERLLEMLKSGSLDAALIALPVADKDLATKKLFDDPFFLTVPKSHKLAKKSSISLKTIAEEKLLLLDEGHCLRDQALEVCSTTGSGQMEFRATSIETLRQMVAAGVGITLIPQTAIRPDRNLAYIPFSSPAPRRTIGMVWRKSSVRQICIKAVLDVL